MYWRRKLINSTFENMAGNSFGTLFRISTFGESHGPAIGLVIDGCPSGLQVDLSFIQEELDRRKPGQSTVTTARQEAEQFEVLSGLYEGKTTGAPLAFLIRNTDARSADYDALKEVYRPSHADYTYQQKYGIRDHRGGGRSSARETAMRVLAGAVAKQILHKQGIDIAAYVQQVGPISATIADDFSLETLKKLRDQAVMRCPDKIVATQMQQLVEQLKADGDSTGGVIACLIQGVPVGLGEPVFDKLQADLAKAMLSINAVHGFEYGSGFAGVSLRGSEHNDAFVRKADGSIGTATNRSGGIQGGISNGEEIFFRVAFKPTATIAKTQQTVNKTVQEVNLSAQGRHDPCVVPRAVPIVEAMAALVILDHLMISAKLI